MSTRPRLSSSLGIYHVVYRGINKQRIFEDDEDYEKFLTILRKYQPICGYKLIAYCLMSNHIHLLIKPGEVPLPRIFQKPQTIPEVSHHQPDYPRGLPQPLPYSTPRI